ncbi:MAG: succinyldiaminopimelate transaminase, partial [Corynebacterium variabile]|nr:succinyldiaminopimelate transaminase [Corynebacterium variabile]
MSSALGWGTRRRVSASLPTFPWDTIRAAKERAAEHPGGLIDLSVGTPVDPTPGPVSAALAAASDAHGYPHV